MPELWKPTSKTKTMHRHPKPNNVQRRCRRRRCLFHQIVEYIDGNEAQGYILINIHGQYFIMNTDTSGYPVNFGRADSMSSNFSPDAPFTTDNGERLSLENVWSIVANAALMSKYVIIYVNNRCLCQFTNVNPPPSAEHTTPDNYRQQVG
ncbi:hypothetical protein PAAG_11156 [Paracoccidioides lutzii Pb01]|uniref:Uncharacterized protein n=1 Tax=Paracoccidioides lutzii (strain ATCC MYA-826 / Pb01) TaxID=502779 RepID=A0A0A2V3B2_PARBA|nr:hypothetical protein PAAG_11156 [Paracoccidioides lutzii Pb01]KGQ01983.1 hypothetical protein PAAG_11156 [Paracoccidioides lutzii Pb01]